jgi:hypothetical protein
MNYEEGKKQIEMTLDFIIANEEQAELKLVGQLHRSEKGEVGVEWQRVEGNDYWLTNVEKQSQQFPSVL